MQNLFILFIVLLLGTCRHESGSVGFHPTIEFGQPVKVQMTGYSGNIMEPFISRDGTTLLFNNLNSAPENTNLHYATRVNDTIFAYQGEIGGVNTADLEGVPTLDSQSNLFFVSTRNYATTLSTLYQCHFSDGKATDVHLVDGVSRLQGGWVNFDVETSADGQFLYYVDAQFSGGAPGSADLVVARKNGSGFERLINSSEIMQNINTDALEYAACISTSQLELYFTRVAVPFSALSSPEIFVSTRTSTNEPFGVPYRVKSITGFAEAATIAPDQRTLYFHKRDSGKFVLYLVRKKFG